VEEDEEMRRMRSLANSALRRVGFEIRRTPGATVGPTKSFSNFDEEARIADYVRRLHPEARICVDIGASDGISMSNTYALFRDRWKGLAVEFDGPRFSRLASHYEAFASVKLVRGRVTPGNVVALLEGSEIPTAFDVLSLDIDGYDHFVLDELLKKFRPTLVCAEINEKIPPPVRFTATFTEDYVWNEDHFYGQSLSQLHLLCARHSYDLTELHYNNAFLVASEANPGQVLTPEEAYEIGYRRQADRREKFPWNADMEDLLGLPPEEVVSRLRTRFQKYEGRYLCSY
jgi:hypothetical protein